MRKWIGEQVSKHLTIDNAKRALDFAEFVADRVDEHVNRPDEEKIEQLQEDIVELERKRDELLTKMHENTQEVAKTTGRYGEQITSEVAGAFNTVNTQRLERIRHEIQAKRDQLRRLQS